MKILYSAFLLFALSGFAYARDGKELLHECQSYIRGQENQTLTQTEQWDSIFCLGFVEGASDMGDMWQRLIEQKGEPPHYCLPEAGSDEQLIRVIVKWLKDNPERLHEAAIICVHNALLKAFPCH